MVASAPMRLTAAEAARLASQRDLVLTRSCADGVHHRACNSDECDCVCHESWRKSRPK